MSDISEKKHLFHEDVLLSNAVKDSLGSARSGRPIYKKGLQHDAFRDALKSELRNLAKHYSGIDVDDETHIERIRGLASDLTKVHAPILYGDEFRFGVAAKGLNVYLKHLWCGKPNLDIRPTHCPFDNNIIELLNPKGFERRWTYGEEKDYREWVRLANQAAAVEGYSNLSEWELDQWKP
jgi:hypothetical protein